MPSVDLARRAFRQGNKVMVLLWRLGLQRCGMANPYAGYIMVLTHTGRRSGLRRRTPLNFAEVGGAIHCVAGYGARSDWYRNLRATPGVEVWLPDGSWWAAEADDVTALPADERLPLVRQVLVNSGFAAHLAGLNPRMSDDALAKATADYRLVRIRRTERLRGPGGPSDLAWVWVPAAAIAVAARLFRKMLRA